MHSDKDDGGAFPKTSDKIPDLRFSNDTGEIVFRQNRSLTPKHLRSTVATLAGTLGHEVGSSPMATAKPVVFVIDDDLWVQSLETLIHDEGWQPEAFASAQEVALKASRDDFLTASDWLFRCRIS